MDKETLLDARLIIGQMASPECPLKDVDRSHIAAWNCACTVMKLDILKKLRELGENV